MISYRLNASIHVSTQVGESLVTNVYHAFPILFMCFKTWDDMVISDMTVFDSMTWFSPY